MTLSLLCTMIYEANYTELKRWSYQDEDVLHDVFIQVYDRLTRGFINTGSTINEAVKNVKNYYKKAITNRVRLNGKQRRDLRPIDELGYLHQAEHVLQNDQEFEDDTLIFERQIKYNTKKVFEWLEKHEDPWEIYVFKLYYFTGLSYDQIAKLHNLKTWAVNNILKKLRSNLRKNLEPWIKMQELYTEVEQFIKSGGCTSDKFHVALELYKRVYPDKYNSICKGCRGKSLRIMQADFTAFLTINKNKVK